jgi:hypothetical protein
MARIEVTSRRNTAYGRANKVNEVELTPRVRRLIQLGVLAPVSPLPKEPREKMTRARPEPVTGVTRAPAGAVALTPSPPDHEGAST